MKETYVKPTVITHDTCVHLRLGICSTDAKSRGYQSGTPSADAGIWNSTSEEEDQTSYNW